MVKPVLLFALLLIWGVITQGGIQSPDDQEPPTQTPPQTNTLFFRTVDVEGTVKSLEDQSSRSAMSSQSITSPLSIDLYTFAKIAFNLQYYFPYCKRCEKLQYFAFRYGNYYLTARNTFLRLQFSSSSNGPTNAQLFTAQQQIDGTWAFKSLTQNKYIRASNDGTTINYQTFVGAWTRWYIERHGNHVHIQSAQFVYNWWIFDSYVLKQLNGGASPLKIEYYPKLQWLWNW